MGQAADLQGMAGIEDAGSFWQPGRTPADVGVRRQGSGRDAGLDSGGMIDAVTRTHVDYHLNQLENRERERGLKAYPYMHITRNMHIGGGRYITLV